MPPFFGDLCNLIILGGIVAVAMSVGCPNCSTTALVAASFSNVFASWMAKENVRLMRAPLGVMRAPIPGIKDRIGGDFNQTALIDYILGFFLSLPVLYTERNQLSAVVTNPIFLMYTAASGVSLCLHNELATKTVRATGGMTSKVNRALMRALLIFGVSAGLGEQTWQTGNNTGMIGWPITVISTTLVYNTVRKSVAACLKSLEYSLDPKPRLQRARRLF